MVTDVNSPLADAYCTGWLVNAADFSLGKDFLLITSAHVISPDSADRYPGSLRPEDATIHFQIQDFKTKAGKIVFHSRVAELDATILELPNLPPNATGLPLDASILKVDTPPQRLYIIGHAGGRDLEFSLQDNHLLAATESSCIIGHPPREAPQAVRYSAQPTGRWLPCIMQGAKTCRGSTSNPALTRLTRELRWPLYGKRPRLECRLVQFSLVGQYILACTCLHAQVHTHRDCVLGRVEVGDVARVA